VPVSLSAAPFSGCDASVTEPQRAGARDLANRSQRRPHARRKSGHPAHLACLRAGSGSRRIGDDMLNFPPADPIP
jgi:hypothetical protein